MTNPSSSISPLLSPTKARRDAAEAQDWAYVFSWLSKKYSPQPVPRFERNAETLATLLELVAANEAADREAELVQQAETDELRRYEESEGRDQGPCLEILHALENALDEPGKDALSALSEAGLLLGAISAEPVEIGERIIALSNEKVGLERQLGRIADLHSRLERETAMAEDSIRDIQSEVDDALQEDIQQRTAQMTRETKQFTTKAVEYTEQSAALEKFHIACPEIHAVKEQEQITKKSQARVKTLERQLTEFHNLPPDIEAARAEYRRAQSELQETSHRRDELFQRMVEK